MKKEELNKIIADLERIRDVNNADNHDKIEVADTIARIKLDQELSESNRESSRRMFRFTQWIMLATVVQALAVVLQTYIAYKR
ncbi:MAG: hypothetical protein WCO35_03110 [Candidatus Nomurabacteria bacterium]